MAYEEGLKCITRIAGADLTAAKYRFVELTAGKVTRCNAAGEAAIGVLQNDPADTEAATIAIVGSTTKVVAGAAITEGAKITTDNEGRAVTASTGNQIHGTAMLGAGAAGEIISVLLQPGAAASA